MGLGCLGCPRTRAPGSLRRRQWGRDVNGKRYDTPEYVWELLKEAFSPVKDAAQAAAGLVSPGPNTIGAAGVAGIRSLLPGSGTYQQELNRYNQAAAPQDSVTDRVPMPGEDPFDAMKRWARSPQAEREVMQTSTMAAPIAVHASPVKWSGQPTRAKAGTGEGGAAYGEGLYATVPSNAKGIDKRYRAEAVGSVAEGPPAPGTIADQLRQVYEHGRMNDPIDRGTMYDYIRASKPVRFQTDALDHTIAEFADGSRVIIPDGAFAPEFTGPATGGSFHVWDVPDRLMDWDRSVGQQSPEAINALRNAYNRRYGAEQSRAFLDGPAQTMSVGKFLDALGSGDASVASSVASRAGIQGHTYAGEAGSARTSGLEGDVPNFVIYDDAAVKPLGTFGSSDEWLQSDLYRQLKPRIDAEEALRRAGQATPDAYADLRRRFGGE